MLYVNVGGADASRLHKIASTIIHDFEKAGLISAHEIVQQRLLHTDGTSNIKFHSTVVNSKYKKNMGSRDEGKGYKGGKGGKGGTGANGIKDQNRIPFDARGILKNHSNFDLSAEVSQTICISAIIGAAVDGYKHLEMRKL